MITRLLNKVNENIETLNNLVQDKEYFKKLDERIEKANNYIQKQKQEIERLNNIINEAIEEVRIYEVQSKDGITNELDNYVFVQRLKNVLNKGE